MEDAETATQPHVASGKPASAPPALPLLSAQPPSAAQPTLRPSRASDAALGAILTLAVVLGGHAWASHARARRTAPVARAAALDALRSADARALRRLLGEVIRVFWMVKVGPGW